MIGDEVEIVRRYEESCMEGGGVSPCDYGEFMEYAQHSSIIAAKDAEIARMRMVALELREWVVCESVNHQAGEFHEYDEPCKVLSRIDASLRGIK